MIFVSVAYGTSEKTDRLNNREIRISKSGAWSDLPLLLLRQRVNGREVLAHRSSPGHYFYIDWFAAVAVIPVVSINQLPVRIGMRSALFKYSLVQAC
jgi:hypothetical protein